MYWNHLGMIRIFLCKERANIPYLSTFLLVAQRVDVFSPREERGKYIPHTVTTIIIWISFLINILSSFY